LPLTQKVTFKAILKKRNLFQVPHFVKRQFKLETTETLKVTVNVQNLLRSQESFFANIQTKGRIQIPQLTIDLLRHDYPSLEGYVIEVTLEPAAISTQ
jgi:hypothetical protein